MSIAINSCTVALPAHFPLVCLAVLCAGNKDVNTTFVMRRRLLNKLLSLIYCPYEKPISSTTLFVQYVCMLTFINGHSYMKGNHVIFRF